MLTHARNLGTRDVAEENSKYEILQGQPGIHEMLPLKGGAGGGGVE